MRFKDLTFNKDEVDLASENISSAFVIKIFHRFERRNEWINWDGDTGLIHRGTLFNLTLEEATDTVEKLRTQGTKFIIDETPAICVTGRMRAIIATELFTTHPFIHCGEFALTESSTLLDVDSKLRCGRWFSSAVYTGNFQQLLPVTTEEPFFSRTSHSTGGKTI